MVARWIGCAPENVRAGRAAGFTPEAIVLHRSGGSIGDLRGRFQNAAAQTSAHYAVAANGAVEQYVSEQDTAFHAGVIESPSWPGVRPNVNPNFYTIGVEHEGAPAAAWPDAQVVASGQLIAEIAKRWNIALTADRIVRHDALRASVACPGPTCPLEAILELARRHVPAPAALPRITRLRAISNLNVRRAPARAAPLVRVIAAGEEIVVSGVAAAGETINGNAVWYIDGAGDFLWAGGTSVPTPSIEDSNAPVPTPSTDGMELDPPVAAPATVADGLVIDRTTLTLAADQFVAEATPKDLIVLHFTAGSNARGAVESWRQTTARVATAYVVDRDGTVFEVFPPKFWAFHLGLQGGTAQERRSIGIELVNVGPLELSLDGQSLNWWPPQNTFKQKYCGVDESSKYVRSTYRKKNFFAAFTDAQIDAVARLVRRLCQDFQIERRIPEPANRLDCDLARFAGFRGVATHVNFRADKWDIGPAFDWDRLGFG